MLLLLDTSGHFSELAERATESGDPEGENPKCCSERQKMCKMKERDVCVLRTVLTGVGLKALSSMERLDSGVSFLSLFDAEHSGAGAEE